MLERTQTDRTMEDAKSSSGLGYYPLKWKMTTDNILPEVVLTKINRIRKKLRVPIGDKEERLSTSAQSTPSVTPCVTPSVTPCVSPCTSPHASPAPNRRNWFSLSPALLPATPELSSTNPADMGGNEGGRGGAERWSLFGTRSSTDPGSETNTGFSLQSYFGLPKSTTLDSIKTQVSLMVDDPANFNPPKIEISGIESQRVAQRPHKLKPRDMNVLTPSGF